ncbi:MAG: phosphoribosylanthranilate isomerase [Lachnospiraceae bacterium]|nr:phosphoribosylanthranilate isomerase [Lachnospiraceae bacterium]
MRTTKMKICGLRRREDVDYVNRWRPDYIGFILAEGFRRQILPEQAAELAKYLDPGIQRVGVFVNQPVAFVSDLLDRGIIQLAQLHGDEDEEYMQDLREVCEKRGCQCRIIQAIRVRTTEDIHQAQESSADLLLLDAWSDKSVGGSGETFDWSLIQGVHRPFLLAGGLGADNVAEAIRRVQPYGIDASSSLETEGYKDPDKIRAFVEAVKEHIS